MMNPIKKGVYIGLYTVVLLAFISCDNIPKDVNLALDLAGDNKKELEAVINHYKALGNNQKLEAAYFLIKNMPYQYHKTNNEAQTLYIDYLQKSADSLNNNTSPYQMDRWIYGRDSTYKIRKVWKRRARRQDKWDVIKEQYPSNNFELVFDIKMISKDLLIENIDEAFTAWRDAPWHAKIDFKKFCKTILPYRNTHDIPLKNRKELVSHISKFKNTSILKTAKPLSEALRYYFIYNSKFEQYSHMTVEDVFKTKNVTCRQQSSVKLATLRALGIPSNQVFAVDGTSWVSIEDENGKVYDFQGESISDRTVDKSVDERRGEKYSKVYMRTYETQPNTFEEVPKENIPPLFRDRNILDVSQNHLSTSPVKISTQYAPPKETNHVYLCIFNGKKLSWDAADQGVIDHGDVIFKNVGRRKIYYPAYYFNDTYYPAASPFYLDKDGHTVLLSPNQNKIQEAVLRRKKGLNFLENVFARLSKGMWFEGANNSSFETPTRLATIVDAVCYNKELLVNQNEKFRYFRLKSFDTIKPVFLDEETGIHMAEVSFFDKKGNKIKGKPIAMDKEFQDTAKNLFDNDIRTNFIIENKPGWVGLDAGKPVNISKIKYLIQNSFNTIEPHDEYELFYWDNTWKSLGKQKAKEDYLIYDIPENAVLWLRNLTKGKAEMVFYIKNGKQIWG